MRHVFESVLERRREEILFGTEEAGKSIPQELKRKHVRCLYFFGLPFELQNPEKQREEML